MSLRVVLFTGAGSSVELGVPAMTGLADEFQRHCKQYCVQSDLVNHLLQQTDNDLEVLIESLDRLYGAAPTLEIAGEPIPITDKATQARAEVEWFVHHSAERVSEIDAATMWGSVIRAADGHNLTIATTNYDRAIEMAASNVGCKLIDGFGELGDREYSSWEGFTNDTNEDIKLLKLHGSTDWYAKPDSNEPIRLRHPVVLHGRNELRLPSGQILRSSLILPSREKRITENPYLRISQTFLNMVDQCELAVFVGSSFRDPHIKDAAETTALKVPTFIVDPFENFQFTKAKHIRQHASTFLISTLPNALKGDTIAVLDANVHELAVKEGGILEEVQYLMQSENSSARRIEMIEHLDLVGATLEARKITDLLEDVDETVARYTLSLILASTQVEELLHIAESSPYAHEKVFEEDLSIVKEMLKYSSFSSMRNGVKANGSE